ncbi:MAG: hypothetical protein JXR96_30030 [Deltaproteobacteria bacterium]|nr:hypothetical protein [Deltaproteobacteria bacterium]
MAADSLQDKLFEPEPPRAAEAVEKAMPARYMLAVHVFLGWLFIVGGALLLLSMLLTLGIAISREKLGEMPAAVPIMLVASALEIFFGWLLLRHVRRTAARRLAILQSGRVVRGVVTGRRPGLGLSLLVGFVPTVIRARFDLPNGRAIESSFKTAIRPIADSLPFGAEVQGVVGAGDEILFPAFFGVRLVPPPDRES